MQNKKLEISWGTILLSAAIFCFALTLGWACWERHITNESSYLDSDEKAEIEKVQRHQEIGYYRAEIENYIKDLKEIQKQVILLKEQIGSANGRVDIMQEYFSKYSPEALVKQVNDLENKLVIIDEKLIKNDIWDSRYVLKYEMSKFENLPTEWEWDKVKARLDQLEKKENVVDKPVAIKQNINQEVPE